MKQWEVRLPVDTDLSNAEGIIGTCCMTLAFVQKLKGTQKTHPGSIHWHVGRPRERGVLEITLWPQARRLWLAVHKGRDALWTRAAAPQLSKSIQRALRSSNAGGLE